MRYELNFESGSFGGSAEIEHWSVPMWYRREEGVEPACPEYIEWIQRSLNKILGRNLVPDGAVGVNTNKAIRDFRKQNGLGDNSKIDLELEVALVRADAALPPISYPPSKPGAAGSTPWIRGLLPLLEKYRRDSVRGDLPLDFLVGWVYVESRGCVGVITRSLKERGYFQIHPGELKHVKVDGQPADPERISTDPEYSVRAGIELVRYYMTVVEWAYKIKRGSDLFWPMVKFQHTGTGYVQAILGDMRKNNVSPTSWEAIRDYVKDNADRIMKIPPFKAEKQGYKDVDPRRLTGNVDELFIQGKRLTPRGGPSPELYFEAAGGDSEFELNIEAEPFHGYTEFDESEWFMETPSEETGLLRMIETGKMSQHCVTLWSEFCKAAKERRRTTIAVGSKKWVIDHEESKLKRWRCADNRPEKVNRICRDVADKVARLKAELPRAEAEQQQAEAVYWALVNRLTNECKLNPATLVCPG